MFRLTLLAFVFGPLISSYALAHGNLVEQAEGATSTCLNYMLNTEPKNLVRHFKSVQTEIAGNEIFSVTLMFREGTTLLYQATGVDGVDQKGDPTFSWKCEKLN